ncbi:YidH family protein [Aurantiacibacter hainanensis]|uniref:YidH family protein n=1 Tax=Aurantiacibacter hainanensis TaxID=3076114 RepID=UPI0030C6E12B
MVEFVSEAIIGGSNMRKNEPESEDGESEKRTDLAEDRTAQATERTFFGALRTAFGAIGLAIAFHVFFGDFEPPWLARGIASAFLVLAAGIALMAGRRAGKSFENLSAHEVETVRKHWIGALSWSVAIASGILIVGLWVLRSGP